MLAKARRDLLSSSEWKSENLNVELNDPCGFICRFLFTETKMKLISARHAVKK